MKKIIFAVVLISLLNSCDTTENEYSEVKPLGASKIDSIGIVNKQVTVSVLYGIPTPCWHYFKTESTNDDKVFTSKVYGQYNGEMCIQVVSILKHEEKINFITGGEKILRFWQNDSTYLDTIITLK